MLRTAQRVFILLMFAIAALMLSPTTANACGYFTGYDDCGKRTNTFKPITPNKEPGRHGGFLPPWNGAGCTIICGEGQRQRTFHDPGPLFGDVSRSAQNGNGCSGIDWATARC